MSISLADVPKSGGVVESYDWLGRTFDPQGFNAAFNAQQAQINRDYQERLSNTAYQRGVADMKAAGLNPYMVYSSGGSSASTPSGSSAYTSGGGNLNSIVGVAEAVGTTIGSLANAAYKIGTLVKPRKNINYYGNFNINKK